MSDSVLASTMRHYEETFGITNIINVELTVLPTGRGPDRAKVEYIDGNEWKVAKFERLDDDTWKRIDA